MELIYEFDMFDNNQIEITIFIMPIKLVLQKAYILYLSSYLTLI